MAEPKPLTFILSDESINSYGFRVLTAGIDLKDFKRNPVMLWNHNRAWRGTKDEVLPIGRWDNIRIDGTRLLADAVFDEKDEFAQSIKSKVEQGIIKMASPGLRVVATSEDQSVIIKGQTRPTVIKCIMKEASVTDIGSNSNALRLWDEFGTEINLSDRDGNHLLPLMSYIKTQNDNMDFQKQVALAVRLSEDASPADILAAVQSAVQNNVELTDLQGQVTNLTETNTTLQDQLKVYQDAEIAADEQKRVDLVDKAIADKKITASERETYLSLAEKDFDSTEKILDGMSGTKELGDGEQEETVSLWDQRMDEINKNLKKR